MPTNIENGEMPLPNGSAIVWTREELSAKEARAFRLEAQLRTYRVTTVGDRPGGGAIVGRYNVPGTHLHEFLFGDIYDSKAGPGPGHAVLTVEALGAAAGRDE